MTGDGDGLLEARRLEAEARSALCEHAARCGREARMRLGGFDAGRIEALLVDERAVRFPTEVRLDAAPLEAGEFAVALPVGASPRDGYVLSVDPALAQRAEDLACAVAYHLAVVNYGDAVTSEAAEAFGAALCGMPVDDYYERLCTIADSLPACCG